MRENERRKASNKGRENKVTLLGFPQHELKYELISSPYFCFSEGLFPLLLALSPGMGKFKLKK